MCAEKESKSKIFPKGHDLKFQILKSERS